MSERIEVNKCEVAKLTSRSWEWGNGGKQGYDVAKVREVDRKLRIEERIFKGLNQVKFYALTELVPGKWSEHCCHAAIMMTNKIEASDK